MPTPATSKREKAAITRALDTPVFRTVATCTGLLLELPVTLRTSAWRMVQEQLLSVDVAGDNGAPLRPLRLHDGQGNDPGE